MNAKLKLLPLMLCSALACASSEPEPPEPSEAFVLVHGAFQDASAWDEVAALLEAEGHEVLVVELPGRNGDPTPHGEITLADHVDTVAAAVASFDEPVVLVGHSFAGLTISQYADQKPETVARLVYLAAYLPRDGESLAGLAEEDHDNGFSQDNFLNSEDYATASVLESDRLMIFCGDCDEAQAERLLADFHDEPLTPMATPVELQAGGLAALPKRYVRTELDNAISLQMQDLMLSRVEVDDVVTLASGHAPFLTQPDAVAELLTRTP